MRRRQWLWIALVMPGLALAAVAGGLSEADVQRWMQTRLALHQLAAENSAQATQSKHKADRLAAAGYDSAAQFQAHGARIAEARAALTQGAVDDSEQRQQIQRLKDMRAAGMIEQGEFESELIELQNATKAAPSRKDWAGVDPHLGQLQALENYLNGRSKEVPTL